MNLFNPQPRVSASQPQHCWQYLLLMNLRFERLKGIKKLFTFRFSWWKYILSSLVIVAVNPSNAIAQCDTTLARGDLWLANDESGSVSPTEFENALDFIYQISDRFTYDGNLKMKASITGWADSKNSENIVQISEFFGDPGDSGLLSTNNIILNNNGQGIRELYRGKQTPAAFFGTRLDYATEHLGKLIKDSDGRRDNTPQVAVMLTDADKEDITDPESGFVEWINVADTLRDETGAEIVLVLIDLAAEAYNNDIRSQIVVDAVVGSNGKVIIVPDYTKAANPTLGYIDEVSQAICDLVTPVPSDPGLLLVKRITAINPGKPDEIQFNRFIDDFGTTDDNDPDWPDPDETPNDDNLHLRGVLDGGRIKPGDEVEYTIYFLSNGDDPAEQVNICDVVPDHLTFVKDGYGQEIGIALGFDPTVVRAFPTKYLSNLLNDDEGDFYGPGTSPPANLCKKVDDNNNLVPVDGSNNDNGAIIVRPTVTLPALPSAVSPGQPAASYGFIRFRARVK